MLKRNVWAALAVLSVALILLMAGCTIPGLTEKENPQGNPGQIANPASVNCVNNGGNLSIVKDANGGEVGMCTLPDGTVCEDWAYFRGECPAPIANMTNPASTNCVEKGGNLSIVKDENGSETGMCTLPDGTVCEEWAYFRGECPAPIANMTNPASTNCVNNGGNLSIVKDANGGEVGMCALPDGTVCEEWAYFRGECPSNSTYRLVGNKTLDFGQAMDAGMIKIKFNGFNTEYDDNPFPAALLILGQDGSTLAQKKIGVKSYDTYTLEPENKTYMIYVEETGNGYSSNIQWASLLVYEVQSQADIANITATLNATGKIVTDNGNQKDTLIGSSIVNVGDTVSMGVLKFRLDDLGISRKGDSPALLSILDANNSTVRRMSIAPGTARIYTGSDGNAYGIYVEMSAPGATQAARWVKIDVYQIAGQPDVSSIIPAYMNTTTGSRVANATLAVGQQLNAGEISVSLTDVGFYPLAQKKPAIVNITDSQGTTVALATIPPGTGLQYRMPSGAKYLVFCSATTLDTSTPKDSTAQISVYRTYS